MASRLPVRPAANNAAASLAAPAAFQTRATFDASPIRVPTGRRPVRVFVDADGIVRIGQAGDATDPTLEQVLQAADADADEPKLGTWGAAWALLLRVPYDREAVRLVVTTVSLAKHLQAYGLQQLFVHLSAFAPDIVAELVVDHVFQRVVPALGPHGLRAAMRELASPSRRRREVAAFCVEEFATAGGEVNIEALRQFKQRERDPDIAETIGRVLAMIEEERRPAGIVSFVGSGGMQVLRTRGDSRSGPAVGIQVLQARGTSAPRKRSQRAASRTGRSRR